MKKIKFGLSKQLAEAVERLAKGGLIYTAGSGFSGGWKTAYDNTSFYAGILEKLGKKFKIANNAPRGGLNGKHIVCRAFNAEKAKAELAITMFEDAVRRDERWNAERKERFYKSLRSKVRYTYEGEFEKFAQKSTSGNYWFPHCPSPMETGIFYKNRQLVEIKFVDGQRVEEQI